MQSNNLSASPEALAQALDTLRDPETYQQMCRNARQAFEDRFSLFELGRRVGAHALRGADT